MVMTKRYSGVRKEQDLEREIEEKENVLNAFQRVKNGKSFTLTDLKVVQRELIRQRGDGYKGTLSMNQAIQNINKEISISKESSHHTKRRMKKRRQDIERLKRQQRLQQQKKLEQEREMEL